MNLTTEQVNKNAACKLTVDVKFKKTSFFPNMGNGIIMRKIGCEQTFQD
jgi:predicted RNA-binding Zn-ribbon protein involved in translation (DUF1610 family)